MLAVVTVSGIAMAVLLGALVALGLWLVSKAVESSRHCARCGKTLVERRRLEGYDEMSGRPEYWAFLSCPDAPIGAAPEGFADYATCYPISRDIDG